MKKLLSIFASVLISLNASSAITIDAAYFNDSDPFCFGGYKKLYIVVTESLGETVSIDNITLLNNYLDIYPFGSSLSGLTTTFEYDVYVNNANAPAPGTIGMEDISITASNTSLQTDNFALNNVQVGGEIIVDFTVADLTLCSNGLPIDLSPYVVQSGGEFSWLNNALDYEYSNSNILDPKHSYQVYLDDGGDGYYIDYYITDIYGCQGSNNLSVIFNDAPNAVITPSASTCASATGGASAIISGSSDINVYWSNGFSELISGGSGVSSITNLSSGVYYINLKDVNGCKNVAKANISDTDISVIESENPVLCAGSNGSVNLSITPSTGSVSSIFWSNGQTTNNLSAPAGEYSVEIHTTANCNYFGTYTIADSALKVKLNSTFDNSICFSTPDGLIDINTVGGSGVGTYTWDWKKNGIPYATSEDLFSITGGVYECTVLDGNSCSLTWSRTIKNYNNVYLNVDKITKPSCGNPDGAIDIKIDPWGDVPSAYSWNTGATTEDLNGVLTGNYTLTYTDQAGCTSYLTVKLPNEKPYQPAICLLTVDTSLIYNQIVWEKDINQNVDGFKVYRETSTFGTFEKVAERPYSLESFFQDNAASPVDRSWRYYITSYDACGEESYGSFIHKTIHVVSNTTNSIDYDLSWDEYEGINYSSVDVFRFDNTNGWTNIDNIPFGTNTTSDTPPVLAGLDYMVSFNLSTTCTSDKAQDHNSSRSNKTASIFNPGGSTAFIEDLDLGLISLYPNPTNSVLTVHLDNPELFNGYEIVDLNGRVVASGMLYLNNTTVDLYDVSAGVYMMRLISTDKIITEKFIKN